MAETPENELTQQKPNIFITGADSGVGLLLTRTLSSNGHRVVGTTENGSQGAYAIRDAGGLPVYPDLQRPGEIRSVLMMGRADIVVHLAAQPLNSFPLPSVGLNAYLTLLRSGTDNLLAAAGDCGVKRLIFPAFSFIYGDHHGASVDEDTAADTSLPLYEAVAAAEAAVQDGAIPGYVLRCGFVYGSNTPATHVLAEALRGGNNVPTGQGLAGWVHEADLMRAILLLIERGFGDEPLAEVFNIVDDTPMTPDQFIDAFAEALGVMPSRGGAGLSALFSRPDALKQALLNQSAAPSNAKAKTQLGWSPQFATQRTGIEQLLLQWRADHAETTSDERALTTVTG